MMYGRISFKKYQMGALKDVAKIKGMAMFGRDLNGQSNARFPITSIQAFEARIATAPVPKSFVHSYMYRWYRGIWESEPDD